MKTINWHSHFISMVVAWLAQDHLEVCDSKFVSNLLEQKKKKHHANID